VDVQARRDIAIVGNHGPWGMRTLAGTALALVAAGCASAAPSTPTRTPVRGELIRGILASTVQLRSEREGGIRRAASGVVIATDPGSRRAWIVTAKHFLDPPSRQQLYVRQPGRSTAGGASVVFVSREHDLAILEADNLEVSAVRLKTVTHLGDDVIVVAFPWGQRFTVVGGLVSQIVAPATGQDLVEGPVRMVSASVSYGSSGGGVFDGETGELVGIVEGYRTAKVAIPEMKERVLEMPVAGETNVIPAATLLKFIVEAGLGDFLPR
jgi:serine protease Do